MDGGKPSKPWWFDGKPSNHHGFDDFDVATKLKLHFVSLFIIQQQSDSRYYGNQPSSCPAVNIMNKQWWGRGGCWLGCHLHATVAIQEKTGLAGRWGELMKIHSYMSARSSRCLLRCVFPSISADVNTLISEQVWGAGAWHPAIHVKTVVACQTTWTHNKREMVSKGGRGESAFEKCT